MELQNKYLCFPSETGYIEPLILRERFNKTKTRQHEIPIHFNRADSDLHYLYPLSIDHQRGHEEIQDRSVSRLAVHSGVGGDFLPHLEMILSSEGKPIK